MCELNGSEKWVLYTQDWTLKYHIFLGPLELFRTLWTIWPHPEFLKEPLEIILFFSYDALNSLTM